MVELKWELWGMGSWFPDSCGGHWYMTTSERQLVDLRAKAEKGYLATGKWQVLHHHKHGIRCKDACEALGIGEKLPDVG